ncbi:MAG: hypothetical protein KGS44_08300 [Alphaproteobacteria bacterium]|nr:hypothetical protein [Alphaproteobacteria bacterium]
MRVVVRTVLDAPAERIWAEVKTPRLLRHVAAPLIVFDLIDPPTMPPLWGEGRYHVGMRFLGFLPIGRQWIVTTTPAPADQSKGVYRIRDNGVGDIAKMWDHLIVIEARPDGRTDYRDEVDVNAGILTLGVWLFAQWFYRHRQARWRGLVRQNFRYPSESA